MTKAGRRGTRRRQDKARLFAAAWVANGRNGTEAARTAGYRGTDASLAVTASRLLRTAKVRECLDKLVQSAEGRAIADIGRVLQVLSEQMEGRAAAEWTTVTGENGVEVVAGRRYRPQAAAVSLGTMLNAADQPTHSNTLVLAGLPDDVLRALYRHVLSSGAGGA